MGARRVTSPTISGPARRPRRERHPLELTRSLLRRHRARPVQRLARHARRSRPARHEGQRSMRASQDMTAGTGGHRPCSLPFADHKESGRQVHVGFAMRFSAVLRSFCGPDPLLPASCVRERPLQMLVRLQPGCTRSVALLHAAAADRDDEARRRHVGIEAAVCARAASYRAWREYDREQRVRKPGSSVPCDAIVRRSPCRRTRSHLRLGVR